MSNRMKDILADTLTEKELELMPNAFDVLGELLIFAEFPSELEKKEKVIGERILKRFKHIKTVLKKTRKFSGIFRLPKMKIIAGRRRKETLYRENGVQLLLHPEKVYFSPRLSTERKRIAELVLPNESVLVMFSGCGVYPAVIAKNAKPKHIVGIEINPAAHTYAGRNVLLNKTENITIFCGDVCKVIPSLHETFDRIIMPLPKSASDFLATTLIVVHPGTIIHLYDFVEQKNFPDESIARIDAIMKEKKQQYSIIHSTLCGQYAPGAYRACIDIRIENLE
ncbi:class I SAM-dependent methyltransferase family protein [Candidatus Woesearchaeota archaeon]|nr:class I SAM-dependent methyltransferase family protein [Candidatus Woesearchaeota archaeon]